VASSSRRELLNQRNFSNLQNQAIVIPQATKLSTALEELRAIPPSPLQFTGDSPGIFQFKFTLLSWCDDSQCSILQLEELPTQMGSSIALRTSHHLAWTFMEPNRGLPTTGKWKKSLPLALNFEITCTSVDHLYKRTSFSPNSSSFSTLTG
jgi:hypothetical protein